MSVRSIFFKALIPVFVPFLVLLLTVFAVQDLLNVEEAEIRSRLADKVLMSHTNVLSKLFSHCSVSLNAHSITKNHIFAYQFKKLADTIPIELEKFKQLPVFSPHQKALKEEVEKSGEEGVKTITGALSAINDNKVADDVKEARAKELYASIKSHSESLHETAQAIGKGVISEEREKGHSHRRIRSVMSILIAYILGLIFLFAFSKHMAKLIEQKKGVSITRRIFFQGVMAVFLPLFILSGLIVFLTDRVHRSENEVRKLVSDISIIEHANAVSDGVAEAVFCSICYAVTKSPHLSDRVDSSIAKIPEEISELRDLFKGKTEQLRLIDRIEQNAAIQTKKLVEVRNLLRDNQVDVAQIRDTNSVSSSHYLEGKVQDDLALLTEPARKVEADSEEKDRAARNNLIAIGAVLASAAGALALCLLYAKTISNYFSSNF